MAQEELYKCSNCKVERPISKFGPDQIEDRMVCNKCIEKQDRADKAPRSFRIGK